MNGCPGARLSVRAVEGVEVNCPGVRAVGARLVLLDSELRLDLPHGSPPIVVPYPLLQTLETPASPGALLPSALVPLRLVCKHFVVFDLRVPFERWDTLFLSLAAACAPATLA